MWVRIPLETYIFILNFSLPPRSEQVNGTVANEIKHVHSPEVIVVLDPRYDLSYKALYMSTCSIALTYTCSRYSLLNINFIYQLQFYEDDLLKICEVFTFCNHRCSRTRQAIFQVSCVIPLFYVLFLL